MSLPISICLLKIISPNKSRTSKSDKAHCLRGKKTLAGRIFRISFDQWRSQSSNYRWCFLLQMILRVGKNIQARTFKKAPSHNRYFECIENWFIMVNHPPIRPKSFPGNSVSEFRFPNLQEQSPEKQKVKWSWGGISEGENMDNHIDKRAGIWTFWCGFGGLYSWCSIYGIFIYIWQRNMVFM